jgi:hypothetical protein
VPGTSRPLGSARGTRRGRPQRHLAPSKTRREARILRPADEHFNLHGKEGVDRSSPSEGSPPIQNRPQMSGLLLPRSTQWSTSLSRRGSVCSMTPISPRRALEQVLRSTSLASPR